MHRTAHLAVIALALLASPRSLLAETKLVADDVAPYDVSGAAVAVSHNLAVLGAPLADGPTGVPSACGSAAIFRYNGIDWFQEKTLFGPALSANDRFGYDVAIDGDLVAIGAPYDDDAANDGGAVHLYRFNGSNWVFEATLVAPTPGAFDEFGAAVDVHGDRVIVGARNDDDRGLDAGAAFVYVRGGDGWHCEATLLAADGGSFDRFGFSVAISGTHALVGAPIDDPFGWGSGSAYAFAFVDGAWQATSKLKPADTSWSAEFGHSVDLDGSGAVVGAWGDDENGWDAGAAYVFRWNGATWTEEAKLLSSAGLAGELFGAAVAIHHNDVLVGAPLADFAGGNASLGVAIRFRHIGATWTQAETLTASANESANGLGTSVAVDDSAYLVGAPFAPSAGSESGCSYVFTLLPTLFADLNADGSVNQVDLAILLGAWGAAGGPADLDRDGVVGASDLALLLGAWTTF